MAYLSPPLISRAALAIVAGTATNNIVPAPGVGNRVRLVGCQLAINRAAGAIADLELRDGANRIVIGYGILQAGAAGTGTGVSTIAPPIPEPGLQLTENTALVAAVVATVAVGTANFIVYYFIDPVT